MERLDRLAEALKLVSELLAEDVLEPDPGRTDWAGMKVRVNMAREALERALEDTAGALEEADDAELRTRIRLHVGFLAARTAALLHAAGSTEGFRRLLERALRIAEVPEQRALLEAGLAEPEPFCRFQHAAWLLNHERIKQADALLKRVAKESRQPALKKAARSAMNGSRPLSSAPTLYTLNSVGVGLYGRRDEQSDGTYVATYCICVLFIPLFPLTAYRVRSEDGNSYQFFSKEPLGPVARVWRGMMLAGLAGGLVWAGVGSYLTSPSRLARLALEEARAAEATLSREDAIGRYRAVIDAHTDARTAQAERAQAGEAVVRLSLVGLPSPCTRDAVSAVGRVVKGLETLSSDVYAGAPALQVGERLEACSREIGQGTPEDQRAALAVVDDALRVTKRPASLMDRRVELQRAVADGLMKERPLQALALYVGLPGQASLDAARAVLDTLGEAPSLWLEAAPAVQAWVDHGDQARGSPEVTRYRERLEAARAAHARDAALIEEGDAAKLTAALKASPGNQELTVALATQARDQGDLARAQQLLAALGPAEGRLTGEARVMRGICHRDAGQLPEADAALSSYVAETLPFFHRAQTRYTAEERALGDRLVTQARAGQMPAALRSKLEATRDEDAQGKIFSEWLSAQLEQDAGLEGLRADYLRHQPVVPATLALGMVKLQRANAAEGEARRTLLGDAERLFLSIRQEAEGNPRYHLGLGQVYHRLGRPEDGDRELQGLVARGEPALTLEVANAYRDMGRNEQARPLCETLHASSASREIKNEAAVVLSLMAGGDLDEEEKWLRRADVSSPGIQDRLLDLEASRLLRDGKLAEADHAAARVVAFRGQRAKHSASAANNASTALITRYLATGDVAHVRTAVRYLEDAARLDPDSAIILGNLANMHRYLGSLRVLERWVRTAPLRLRGGEAEELLSVLLDSDLREDVLQAMAAEPALRRSQELSLQEQTLAPGRSDAWERQLEWLGQRRDERGLSALARRLEAVPSFAGDAGAEGRRKWESGELDAQLSQRYAQQVTWAEAALKRAEQTRHVPTVAMAWELLGEAILSQLAFEHPPERIDAMVSAYRQAEKLWPALGTSANLDRALIRAALERGLPKSEALAQVWEAERRQQATSMVVHHALSGPAGAEVARVLRAQPELQEAAEHARKRTARDPQLEDWVLAKAAGDVVLEQAAAAVFARPDVETRLALDVKLSGDHPRERAKQTLYQQGKALQGRP